MAFTATKLAEGRTTQRWRVAWEESDGVPSDSEILRAAVAHNYGGEVVSHTRRHDPDSRTFSVECVVNID